MANGVIFIDLFDPTRPESVGLDVLEALPANRLAGFRPFSLVSQGDLGMTVLQLDRGCVPPRLLSGRVIGTGPQLVTPSSSASDN